MLLFIKDNMKLFLTYGLHCSAQTNCRVSLYTQSYYAGCIHTLEHHVLHDSAPVGANAISLILSLVVLDLI